MASARFVEMRFRFQIHVLSISVPEGPLDDDAVRALVGRFIESYEARFGEGSAFSAAGVELTTFRVVSRSRPSAAAAAAARRRGARRRRGHVDDTAGVRRRRVARGARRRP